MADMQGREEGGKERRREDERKEGERKEGREEYKMQGSQHEEVNLEEIYSNKRKDLLTQTFYYRRMISVKIEAKDRIMKQMR